jgi:hypothetical protein
MKIKVELGTYEKGSVVEVEIPNKILNLDAAREALVLAEGKLDEFRKTWEEEDEPEVVQMHGPEGQPFYDYMNMFTCYFDEEGNRK